MMIESVSLRWSLLLVTTCAYSWCVASAFENKWIACTSTQQMVDVVSQCIRPSDSVVEIGSQLRDVSQTILQHCHQALFLDVQRKFPKGEEHRTKAMRRPGDEDSLDPEKATFCELAHLDDWRRVLQPDQEYAALVLDVNAVVGNDLELTTLSIVREFVSMFPSCRTVVVKSMTLGRWATQLVHAQRWIRQPGRSGRSVIATVGVEEYRSTIPTVVHDGDAVLEIGCHLGTTTALLRDATPNGYTIGVDVGPRIIRGAKMRYSDVPFYVGDAWKTAELLRIQQGFLIGTNDRLYSRTVGFDVVYIDVGGLSGNDGLFEALALLSSISNALEPRCIVIKSQCVRRLSSTLVPAWQLLNPKTTVED